MREILNPMQRRARMELTLADPSLVVTSGGVETMLVSWEPPF